VIDEKPPMTNAVSTAALHATDASTRLAAALATGSRPDERLIDTLVERCAVEPDFYVRDMLAWALLRHPPERVVPKLLAELQSQVPQARSQALHTLSKIRAAGTWRAITPALLQDSDDEVARSAWRAAVVLAPEEQKLSLATFLASQLGRGDRQLQLSLSRALVALGAEAVSLAVREAGAKRDATALAHARATERLLRDPESGFLLDIEEAKRVFVLSKQR
jgi:HEAT repeat protein